MKKNKKLHQLGLISAITSSILIASSIAVTVPLILNTNNNTNTLNDTKETKMVTTGNITHDASVPVVNSLAEVDYSSLQMGYSSSSVIVNQNGKQEIYVWGNNQNGQLGLGDTRNKTTPILFDTSVFGEYSDIEIKFANYGYKFNDNDWFQTSSSYAIITMKDKSQKLFTWGQNNNGKLGLDLDTANVTSPSEVSTSSLGNFDNIHSIYGNENNIYVIVVKSGLQEIYWCGFNNFGIDNKKTFQLILNSDLGNYSSIVTFIIGNASVGVIVSDISDNRSVYVWGNNANGQLGLGHTNKVLIPTILTNSIFSSDMLKNSTLVIDDSSYLLNRKSFKIYVWGKNDLGQLGTGNFSDVVNITELTIPGGNGIIDELDITSRRSFIKTKQNGIPKIYVWGYNSSGDLGLGDVANRHTPSPFNMTLIGSPPTNDFPFKLNTYGSYALVENVLYGWGWNNADQLGVSGVQRSPIRVPLQNNYKIVDASIDELTTIIVDNNGVKEVYALGVNTQGQLGNGSTANVTTPMQILSSKESTPSAYTNKTFNLSAGDALKSFYGELTNIYNENELLKYIDISTLPSNANLSIDPANTIINSSEGVLDLTLVTDSYYELFKNGVVNNKKSFQFSINGFLKVSDIPIVTKITPNITNENFFQNAVVGNTVNRNYLSQFINLDCIPADAILTIEPIKTDISSEIKFVLKSNKVYKNNGVSTNENYSQTFSFTMKPGIDPILVIGLIAGGCFLLLLIFVIVYMSKSRIRKI